MGTKKKDGRWTSIPMTNFLCRCTGQGCDGTAMAFYKIKAVCDGCKRARCGDVCRRPRLKTWEQTVTESNSLTFQPHLDRYDAMIKPSKDSK